MADTAEYLARLKASVAGRDPVAIQRNTARHLSELLDGVPDETLRRRANPDKWSIAEILAHLAEDEIASGWRYRLMIEHDGCDLASFNQELWAQLGNYASRSPQDSLQLFRLLREANLVVIERLTPDEWQRHGIHAERGLTSVEDLVRHIAAHDLNHIEQIRRLLGEPRVLPGDHQAA